MSLDISVLQPESAPQKFSDPDWTATRERRATVALERLDTLWINTGTLCNITCQNCYIESSPSNDRLVYITARGGRGLLRRDRGRRARHARDRLHRRRAVHEPAAARHGRGRAAARLRGAGAEQRHAAHAAAQGQAGPARSRQALRRPPDDPRQPRPPRERPCTRPSSGARTWARTIAGLDWLSRRTA